MDTIELSGSGMERTKVSFDGCDFESKISETSPDHDIHASGHYQTDQLEFSVSVVIDQTSISEENTFDSLHQFEMIEDIAAAAAAAAATLDTNIVTGTHRNDASNVKGQLPINATKGFLQFTIESIKDTTVLLLLCCATLSLALGIKKEGLEDGWYDGATIFLAVFLVVVITTVMNFYRSRKHHKLSRNKNIAVVDVMREGRPQQISICNILVGDIVSLKTGDRVPADGLFINGNSLELDDDRFEERVLDSRQSPNMFTGTKVIHGNCTMRVTLVGENTEWGKMMRSVRCDSDENTQLQTELDKLNSYVEKIGLCFALLLLVVLLLRCFAGEKGDDENGDPDLMGKKTIIRDFMNEAVRIIKKQGGMVNALVSILTVCLLGIQEGLPLGVTLSLTYSAKRMSSEVAVEIKKLSACATIGSATTICIDKTCYLNSKMIANFWIGQEVIMEEAPGLAQNLVQTLREGIGLNMPEHAQEAKEAVLCWAKRGLDMDMEELKRNCAILRTQPSDFEKKRCGFSVLKRKGEVDNIIHVHWRGAPEILLPMCSDYYGKDGIVKTIDEHKRQQLEQIIEGLVADNLHCIAFAHKQIVKEEPEALKPKEDCLTLLAMVGLKYACVPEVRRAVETCREAGVNIKLVSEDDVKTARFKAMDSEILRPDEDITGELVIEAQEFRNWSEEERREMVNKIRVMANSSPSDKLLMVQCLRQKGEVVSATGVSTRDSPSLKEADIGLSMGNQISEAAKENSQIIILDQNLSTIATLLLWGRYVYNSIQKFIQLHLTINIAGIAINFMAAVSSGEAPLAPIQFWWVNLTMGILGALALAAEPPSRILIQRAPVRRADRLITKAMWRNILFQALYQITVFLTLHFKGEAILGVNQKAKTAMIFNSYFLCQVFVMINARELERKNVLKKSRWFMGMVGIAVVLQLVVIGFTDIGGLDLEKCSVCIGIGALSLPIGWGAKWIPIGAKSSPVITGFHP